MMSRQLVTAGLLVAGAAAAFAAPQGVTARGRGQGRAAMVERM